jgi:hypothetical protein
LHKKSGCTRPATTTRNCPASRFAVSTNSGKAFDPVRSVDVNHDYAFTAFHFNAARPFGFRQVGLAVQPKIPHLRVMDPVVTDFAQFRIDVVENNRTQPQSRYLEKPAEHPSLHWINNGAFGAKALKRAQENACCRLQKGSAYLGDSNEAGIVSIDSGKKTLGAN